MELKSMKLSAEEKQEIGESVVANAPDYPYGLCLYLDEDALQSLGLSSLPEIGSTVKLEARAIVQGVSQSQRGDELNRTLNLQITDMAVGPDSKGSDPSKIYDGG